MSEGAWKPLLPISDNHVRQTPAAQKSNRGNSKLISALAMRPDIGARGHRRSAFVRRRTKRAVYAASCPLLLSGRQGY